MLSFEFKVGNKSAQEPKNLLVSIGSSSGSGLGWVHVIDPDIPIGVENGPDEGLILTLSQRIRKNYVVEIFDTLRDFSKEFTRFFTGIHEKLLGFAQKLSLK